MEAIWDAIASFASMLWDAFTGVLTWITSLFSATFTAAGQFLKDWIFYGLDWAQVRQIALLNGYDIQLPTFSELLKMAPQPMYDLMVRVGIPTAAQIISAAIGTKAGLSAWRLAMWLGR